MIAYKKELKEEIYPRYIPENTGLYQCYRWVGFDYKSSISVINVDMPDSEDKSYSNFSHFLTHRTKKLKSKSIILLGAFNFFVGTKLSPVKSSSKVTDYIKMLSSGWLDISEKEPTQYTYFGDEDDRRLDYVFLSPIVQKMNYSYHVEKLLRNDELISDHALLEVDIEIEEVNDDMNNLVSDHNL